MGNSQTEDVLRYMKEEGSITCMDAFREFGATRLSAIIFSLRKRGYKIDTEMIMGRNRYGRRMEYGKYTLRQ